MRHRRAVISTLVVLLAVGGIMAACGGPPEPEGPTPEELEQMRQDSIAEARQDSIRRLQEQMRRDSIEDARRREERQRAMAAREAARAREILETMIHFDFDKSNIRPDAEQILQQKVGVLRANQDMRIRIEGHADERGSVEYNLALGQRRAESAKDFLVGFGLDPSRFETTSFGESQPLVDESNEEAWAENRRDEFVILGDPSSLRVPGGTQ